VSGRQPCGRPAAHKFQEFYLLKAKHFLLFKAWRRTRPQGWRTLTSVAFLEKLFAVISPTITFLRKEGEEALAHESY